MSRRTKIAGYALFTLFALGASFVLTFPYGALGRRLEAEAAKGLPGTTVAIGEIGPALPVGVRLADVVIARELRNGTVKIGIDRIRVRPAFLSLLAGRPGVVFSVDAFSGSVTGEATRSKAGARFEAVVSGLQLDSSKTIEEATGLKLAGGVSGRVELSVDPKGEVVDGNLAAVAAAAKLKGGKVMGFPVPALDLGSPELSVVIKKGQATITKAGSKSPDLELKATGQVSLRPDLLASLVKGTLKVRPTEAFLRKNPSIQSLLGFAGPFKRPDGSLELPLDGPLAMPLRLPMMGRF